MARPCLTCICDKTAPIAVRLVSVNRMKVSFIIGKVKMGGIVRRDVRVSKTSWDSGVQLKVAVISLGLWNGRAVSAKFSR